MGNLKSFFNLGDYRVHVPKGEEEYWGKCGLDADADFFDVDTLNRIYGENQVRLFFLRRGHKTMLSQANA